MFFECKRKFAKKISIVQINIDNVNNINILQLKRWQHIIEDRPAIGTNPGLDPAFLIRCPNWFMKLRYSGKRRVLMGSQHYPPKKHAANESSLIVLF